MARKNGDIDLILAPSSDRESETENGHQVHNARLLCTIHEHRMRVGVERWVGLKLTNK